MVLKNTWVLGETYTHTAQNDVATQVNTNTTAIAGKQGLDADLTAIAALTTTSFGRSLLTSADATAARATIDAVDDFDARLDDNRTPIDGSVSAAKLDASLTASLGALTSPYFSISTTGYKNADNNTNTTAKATLFGLTHYTNAEEPLYGMRLSSDATNNTVEIGGGTSSGNAATTIRFYTAANNTTVTGTEWTTLASNGDLVHRGALWMGSNTGGAQNIYLNSAAAQFRSIQFLTAGNSRWILRTNNAAESGSDAGSNLELVSRTDAGASKTTIMSIDRASGATTFGGLLSTLASATGTAGLRIPHGAAPTSPVNGDMWTTTGGLFVRINGVTKTVTTT